MADRVDEITTMKSDSESQSQLFSSQSDDENAVESEATTIGQKARSLKPKKFPQLIDTLALCYLAALLLRLPVLPGDLHSWVANGELLYHGSLKSIPVDMTVRLPATYKSVLEPKIILQRDKLQKAITDVALEYQHNIGIRFPPINFPLVCLRCVKELALPLDMYPSVARLARLVNYNFTFPDMEHTRYARKTSLPMDQLAALLVVATKLSYPFDGKPRVPKSATEPAALVIDWAKWNEIMSGQPEKNRSKSRKSKRKSSKSGKPFGFAEAMAVKESDVMNMSRDQMDKYLDWYGQVWTSNEVIAHEKDAEFRKEMLAMFPVDTSKEAEPWGEGVQDVEDDLITARLQAVMASLKIREPVSDADADHGINRPGSYYKQWRREEDLTEYGKQFAEAVSKLVGVSLERLIRVVFQTEMKLRVWIKEQED